MLLALFSYWQRRAADAESCRTQSAHCKPFLARAAAAVLASASIAIGVSAIAVSLLFVHLESRSYLIAVLQPMSAFVLVYFCLLILLGGAIAEFPLRRAPWCWAILFAGVGVGIGFSQHRNYPASPHLELPGMVNQTPWNQASLWIRANTPVDAIFALDADYIHARGEGFRVIAERDSIADFTKDGGTAAIFPGLAQRWMAEHLAQTGINLIDDDERRRRLVPFHVTWMILARQSPTAMPCPALPCPFQNDTVKAAADLNSTRCPIIS